MSKQTRRCRCPRCGSIFFTEIRTKVYCDTQCRKAAENSRLRHRKKGYIR